MFIMSTQPLFQGGPHEVTITACNVWKYARRIGLARSDYGRTWFVYESKQDYLDSLD